MPNRETPEALSSRAAKRGFGSSRRVFTKAVAVGDGQRVPAPLHPSRSDEMWVYGATRFRQKCARGNAATGICPVP
jgi:hypothetical protein